MPFNGTGTFSLVSGNPVVTGTNISSTVQNNTMTDFANGFTNCITRDGQSAPTSNLPMGNRRHTGAADATGAGEYLVYGQSLPATTIASLTVTGAATVGTTLGVTGASTLASASVTGNATVGGTLGVTGVATFGATAVNSAGLTVGNVAQAGATVLDWYEEGSFTPAVTFGGAAVGVTYNVNRSGSFTRIGNTVAFRLRMRLTNKGSSTGSVAITGFPYNFSASGSAPVFAVYADNMSGLSGAVIGQAGSTTVGLSVQAATTVTALTDTNFTNTSDIYISGTYQV